MNKCPVCLFEIKSGLRCTNTLCSAYSHKVLEEPELCVTVDVKELCPECEGGGFIGKMYPSGHTEVTCGRCDGVGFLDE